MDVHPIAISRVRLNGTVPKVHSPGRSTLTFLRLAGAVWGVRAVTISTLLRGRCVKKYSPAIYYTVEFVAVGTASVAVGLSKREGRLFVVVEE